ncbi:Cyanate permease [Pediococcus damnosus]|uniref:Cyanate permease n=1 Tax=Pediococcus damnosus TaxID=51663 RepID=A0AAC9B229_9LACO|nr:MFS transporter [Pediococcus damnosus]AMV62822.1 Cyanate permease [Pediococcus damnosus]AMV67293.1 Cyanate permease [Pediococcus damnosus]KRN54033.1 cyanate permease [Pediococcus damnosus]PIO81331.1 MFS transporter [Pediococcus damnosus]
MSRKKDSAAILTFGIFLVGANLRLPITMLPPLLSDLKRSVGLAPSLAGLLTTIPLVMFALISPLIAKAGNKYGSERTLLAALILLTIGSYLRIIPTIWALMIGTCLVGAGIAGGNVLLPAIIKERFPTQIAIKTSLYTVSMGLVASIGTGFSGLLATKTNLQTTMGTFSLVGVAGLIVWVLCLLVMKPVRIKYNQRPQTSRSVWRASLAWIITLFFGIQSLLYYSLLTWLPTIWISRGFSTVQAGSLATLFQLSVLPLSLTVPLLAEKKHGMRIIVAIVGIGFIGGAAGLSVVTHGFWINAFFSIIMGAASGAAFSVCIVFFQKKATTVQETTALSGMAQSLGYIVGAVGPVLFGFVQNRLNSWEPILILVMLLSIIMTGLGILINHRQTLFKRI